MIIFILAIILMIEHISVIVIHMLVGEKSIIAVLIIIGIVVSYLQYQIHLGQ